MTAASNLTEQLAAPASRHCRWTRRWWTEAAGAPAGSSSARRKPL